MWYSTHPQITYNRIFNFVVGVRGGGKTFNALKESIEKHLKERKHNGEKWEFLYIRRTLVELDDACVGGKNKGDLFSDIRKAGYFKGHELKVTADKSGGYTFYCDGVVMGYGKALSVSGNRRSTSLPYVQRIVFDEFLINTSAGSRQKYLNNGNEFFIFTNLYETVARGRDIPVFFIGNAFSMVNPYFIALDIRIQNIENNKIYKGKSWTVLFWRDEGFIEERKKTQFYQATEHTDFNKHAFGNHFFLDKKDFIRKRPVDTEHQFSLVYMGHKYGVWVDWDKGIYYVSKKGANAPRDKTIAMSMEDNRPNNVNIRLYRNMPFIKAFRLAVESNNVYYDNQETYNNMNEVVYLLRTIT